MSLQENYRGIRKRLLNPPGGRVSSELEIVSETVARRMESEQRAKERAKAEKLELRRRRIAAMAEARRIKAKWAAQEEAWIKSLNARGVSVRSIIEHCCKKYSVSPLEIVSLRRTGRIVHARHIIVYLCCTLTTRSLPEIGRCLGGRDHTTAINSRERVKEKMLVDPAFAAEIEGIKAALQPTEEAA